MLSWSLNRIFEANQVLNHIERNIATKYDITNPEHEEKLVKVRDICIRFSFFFNILILAFVVMAAFKTRGKVRIEKE